MGTGKQVGSEGSSYGSGSETSDEEDGLGHESENDNYHELSDVEDFDPNQSIDFEDDISEEKQPISIQEVAEKYLMTVEEIKRVVRLLQWKNESRSTDTSFLMAQEAIRDMFPGMYQPVSTYIARRILYELTAVETRAAANRPDDVAFLLSADGFQIFRQQHGGEACPVILINLNLPPQERFKIANILIIAVLSKKPKDLNSFLHVIVNDHVHLA
ncbi:hypothetical protein HDU96_004365, partial [Phlyctochytrium bullatum]